jgi:hypothetical protein
LLPIEDFDVQISFERLMKKTDYSEFSGVCWADTHQIKDVLLDTLPLRNR